MNTHSPGTSGALVPKPPRVVSRRTLLAGAGATLAAAFVGSDLARGASAEAAWGGYSNGQIPLNQLTSVSGRYFRSDAAASMNALRAAYAAAVGRTLTINDGYRDLANQWVAWNNYQNGGNLAAYPGTSNHGWGTAVDFGGEVYSSSTSQGHRWLQAHAAEYGWWWAGRHFSQVENWHWEYTGSYTPPPTEVTGGVKEIAVHGSAWSAIPVGQIMSNVFSAVNMGSGWGDIYGSLGGHMQLVGVSGGAWTRMDSGLALSATSLSALNVGQSFPHVFAVENGVLQHISVNSAGWQKQSTGVSVPGKISGVVLPGNNVQLVANVGGIMHHITTHSGWEIGNSGIPIGSEFKAVNIGGQLQIVTVLNGIIHLIWPGAGWQLQSTGLPASGSLTAVDMGGGYPTIIANEGWNITVTSVSNGGWVRQAMGVATSGNIDAVNLGGNYPTIYAV